MSEGMDFDLEMVLLLPFSWGAATNLGLVEDNIVPFIDAGRTLFESGNISISLGVMVAILSLVAVLVNRDASITETAGVDAWMVYATIGLVMAPPLFPTFAETLASGPAALIAFSVQSAGFLLVSYTN